MSKSNKCPNPLCKAKACECATFYAQLDDEGLGDVDVPVRGEPDLLAVSNKGSGKLDDDLDLQPPIKPQVIEVVLDGFLGRFIYRHNRAATTIPLPFLTVILYFTQPLPEIRTHEFVHVEQRQALGLMGFWVNYLRNTIKFGYKANPMEVAAYQVQAERPLPGWAD